MRRIIRTTGLAAAGFVLALGVAAATDRAEQAPESRAYFGFSFGGEKAVPRDFHYGLRVDHDSRFVDGAVPPLMQFDFTRRGLNDARVNGLSVLKQQYRLRQSEEDAAAEAAAAEPAGEAAAEGAAGAAAEEGFFSGLWTGTKNFFGGLFGGDDGEEVAEEAVAGEEMPAEAAPEELAEGAFANFGIVDWGLLALGVAGLGLTASEVSGGDEDPSRQGGATTGATTTGTTPTGTTPTGTPVLPTSGLVPIAARLSPEARERIEWLDGGTGHMGDLYARDE